MATTISVQGLRHIPSLTFEVPSTGVWLLTGSNGFGKTTLLGCLRRIGYPNAFPVHFPTSRISDRLDPYDNASVCYEIDGSAVTYTYRGERWVPTPKANSRLLSQAGYPEVLYIAANSARLEPRAEDFAPYKVRDADQAIVDAANRIFQTRKFDTLRKINVRRGVGNEAFLRELPSKQVGKGKWRYFFSERNFSLGELCVLKLLRSLEECAAQSMILIDELELALHPSAQSELLRYLETIASARSLTIIVSTHSATLIKQARRKQLLFLEKDSAGDISCLQGCYPSYILGRMAAGSEAGADVVIYVEDEAAETIVIELIARVLAERPNGAGALAPTCQAIPVGGFSNVLRLYDRQRRLLPARTLAKVLLDGDAQTPLAQTGAPDLRRIQGEAGQNIQYLPFTPEVGLVGFLRAQREGVENQLRGHFRMHNITIRQEILPDLATLNPDQQRQRAKAVVREVADAVADVVPNGTADEVKVVLLRLFAADHYAAQRDPTREFIGRLVSG